MFVKLDLAWTSNSLADTKYYQVRADDSLLKIAYIFNMNISFLKSLNNLISDDVYPGQILKVVDKAGSHTHLLANTESELQKAMSEENLHHSITSNSSCNKSTEKNEFEEEEKRERFDSNGLYGSGSARKMSLLVTQADI